MHRRAGSRFLIPALLLVLTAALLGAARHDGPRPSVRPAATGTDVDVPAHGPAPMPAHRRPPEAPAPSSLTLVGLGDSVTAGSACDCPTFVELYARRLGASARRAVHAQDLGVPGQTSRGLLGALSTPSPARSAVQSADVVTVTIGANDLDPEPVLTGACAGDPAGCYGATLAGIQDVVGRLIDRIHALRAGRATTIQVTGYWDVWKDGAVARGLGPAYVAAGDRLTVLANRALGRAAQGHGASYVDLWTPFRGADGSLDDTGLLAADGDHPDAQGHQVIADALAATPAAAALAAEDRSLDDGEL